MLLNSTHEAHSRLRFALAALCCAVFAGFLALLPLIAARDPLALLLDVRFSALGVCLNFAVCLGSVALFGVWRRRAQRNQAGGA